MILLFIGIGALQVMLDKGYDLDWFRSHIIRLLACCSIVGITLLIIWECFHEHPIMDLTVFKTRDFSLATVLICLPMFILFSNLVVGPLWVQSQLGYTPEWAGFTLAPLGISAIVCFPLVGRFLKVMDARLWVLLSYAILFISLFMLSRLNIHTPFRDIGWSRFIMGIGFALFYVPLATIALGDVSPQKVAQASSIFSFARTLSISAGVSLGTNYWLRTANFFKVAMQS